MLHHVVVPVLRCWIGLVPPPMLTMTFGLGLVGTAFPRYILRGVSRSGSSFTKGEAELFATFVSNLNTCHF